MKKKVIPINIELRRKAEERLNNGNHFPQTPYPTSEEDTQRLLYELQVRQIELELQNEELQQLQEETRRFRQFAALHNELFDAVPVGCCTVSFASGKILQANLSAQCLLGFTREEIMGRYFAQMVAPESRAVVSELFVKVIGQGEDGNCNAELLRNGNIPFWAHLEVKVNNDGQSYSLAIVDMSERKEAEEALRAGYRELSNLKTALESIAIVSITDTQGTILYANEKFETITQYDVDEIIGQNHRMLNSKYHEPEFFRTMWQTISSGKAWRGEICNRAKNGSLFWVDSVISPVRNEHGKVYQYLCIRYDISERKQSDLRQLRQLSMAVNKTTNAIIITDTSGHITWVNEGFINLTGYSLVEAHGKRPGSLLQGGETDWKTILAMRNALHQGQGFEVEIINYTKDNKSYWASVKADPFWGDDGALMGYIAVHKDITKRKQAEASLQFQAKLLNSIGDAVIATDLQGAITYWNRAAEELYGWSSGELLGKLVTEILPTTQNMDEAREIFFRLTKGISWTGEFDVQKKDGMVFHAHVTDIPLVDENGIVTGILGVSRNITEQKRSDAKLSFSEAKLRAVFDSSVQVYFLIDSEFRIIAFSKAAAEFVRQLYQKEIFVSDDIANYILPDYIPIFEGYFLKALHGESCHHERVLEFSGRQIHFEFQYLPIRDSGDTIIGVAFSALNISEQRSIEQSLQQYEQEREKNYHESQGYKAERNLPSALPKAALAPAPLGDKSQSGYLTIPTLTQGNILLNARKDIVYLKGAKDYTEIVTSSGKQYLCNGSLGSWEKRLFPQGFIRVHRSYIVNMETIHSWHHSGNVIILNMRDGEQITVSRGYRAYFLSYVS
ncbi:MAG: PAS domain S-box protein [Candidatus Kapabacteria bacterium]|nr:PAS domain S-box protein [Candidatus Kapabacteria bacterium]